MTALLETHEIAVRFGGVAALSGVSLDVGANELVGLIGPNGAGKTTFIDAVRDCLKTGGWAKKDDEREEGGTFLVGVKGRLFTVEDDYQVGASADGYAAVGCGSEIALGALFATARTRMSPERRLTVALEAAERFSAGVRGPFLCLSEDTPSAAHG